MTNLFNPHVLQLSQNLKYYYLDFWNEKGYYSTNSVSFLNKGPWYVILFTICFVYYFLNESQKMNKRQNGYNIKPFILIWNGYNFGVYGVCFLIFLNFLCYFNLNTCDFPNTLHEESIIQTFIYILVIILITRFTNILDILLLVWSKNSSKISFGLFIEVLLGPLMCFFFIKFYSPGLTVYLVTLDCFFNCINYGILTRACADMGGKFPSDCSKIINRLKMLQYMLQSVYLFYFLNHIHCSCSSILKYTLITCNTTLFLTYLLSLSSHLSLVKKSN